MPEPTALASVRIAPRAPSPRKPPLLLLLHGYGTDEHDLLPVARSLDPRFDVRSARATRTLAPGRNAWFDFTVTADGERHVDPTEILAARDLILRFIDEAVAADGADPERVYVAGFSQGAMLALVLALTNPDRIAGAVAMSGRVPPELAGRLASNESLTGIPVLVVHGTQDTMMPVENARATRALLSGLPVSLTYQEFPMPHTISPDSERLVSTWLKSRLDGPRRDLQSR